MYRILEKPRLAISGGIVYALACLVLTAALLLDDSVTRRNWLLGTALFGPPVATAFCSYHARPESHGTRWRQATILVAANSAAVLLVVVRYGPTFAVKPIVSLLFGGVVALCGTIGITLILWAVSQHIANMAFRLVRRFPSPPECLQCGYNLTGNVSGRCPECGVLLARGQDGER